MFEEETTALQTVPARPVRRAVAGLLGVTRDLTLASIGVVSVVTDDVAKLYSRSVERGHDNVRRVQEKFGVPLPTRSGNRGRGESEYTSEEWRTALAKLNVVSPQDVDLLVEQMAELEAKVAMIMAQQTPE